jgi:hypothetical protein
VEYIANRTVVDDHYLAQVGLDLAEVLNVCSITMRAMLTVVTSRKVGPLKLQPVNHRVGIFLHRSGKNDKIIPFGNLQ